MVKEQRSSRTRQWPARSGRRAAPSERFCPGCHCERDNRGGRSDIPL